MSRVFQIPPELSAGMLLLAAAPFAPVVPIFARFARADVALAGALTALFPFFSAFLTPLACELSLGHFRIADSLKFNFLLILVSLVATITLPLALGTGLQHRLPALGARLLKPFEYISETAGAISARFRHGRKISSHHSDRLETSPGHGEIMFEHCWWQDT